MAQLNIHMTRDLEEALEEVMRLRAVKTKSEAIRLAVKEAAARARGARRADDFRSWIGLARQCPENPHPRFPSDDELWEDR